MNRVWIFLNGLMAAVFLFAAVLQLNDEDPVRWIALYAAAAVPCILVVLRREHPVVPALVAAASLIWAVVYAAQGAWSVPPGEMFAEWEMKNAKVRETREMFGLLIVAVWMLALLVVGRWAKPRA